MTDKLKQYVKDAIRTESTIDTVNVNERLLTSTLQGMIHLGAILDMIKKNTFYGKTIDVGTLNYHFTLARATINGMADINTAEINTTDKNTLPVNPRLFHAVIGTVTEAVELIEALDLYSPMDNINILEEFFDINWYEAIAIDELGGDWQTILDKGIEKLRVRYPEKFTNSDAINRDVDKERNILNQMLDQSE